MDADAVGKVQTHARTHAHPSSAPHSPRPDVRMQTHTPFRLFYPSPVHFPCTSTRCAPSVCMCLYRVVLAPLGVGCVQCSSVCVRRASVCECAYYLSTSVCLPVEWFGIVSDSVHVCFSILSLVISRNAPLTKRTIHTRNMLDCPRRDACIRFVHPSMSHALQTVLR